MTDTRIERCEEGYVLTQEQFIERPLEDVWAFFSAAENLERLTPSFLSFRILTPCPIEMKTGALIDYRISLFGVPMTWRTEITEYSHMKRFADSQLRGPYSRWYHTHTFEAVEGGTRMVDRVEYRVPLGVLGRFAHSLFIHRTLRRIFGYRRTAVDTVFTAL